MKQTFCRFLAALLNCDGQAIQLLIQLEGLFRIGATEAAADVFGDIAIRKEIQLRCADQLEVFLLLDQFRKILCLFNSHVDKHFVTTAPYYSQSRVDKHCHSGPRSFQGPFTKISGALAYNILGVMLN